MLHILNILPFLLIFFVISHSGRGDEPPVTHRNYSSSNFKTESLTYQHSRNLDTIGMVTFFKSKYITVFLNLNDESPRPCWPKYFMSWS